MPEKVYTRRNGIHISLYFTQVFYLFSKNMENAI